MNFKKRPVVSVVLLSVLGIVLLAVTLFFGARGQLANILIQTSKQEAAAVAAIGDSLNYDFQVDGVLDEAGSMDESWSPYFWLNSGGKFYLENGIGKTIHGDLPTFSKWRLAYSAANPRDTDDGYHPQNLFRLLTRSTWRDASQELDVRVNRVNTTKTPQRGAWSGIFLMSRYQDQNNLYYAGIRMDGGAVIKKKYQGTYYTMDYTPRVYGADAPYRPERNSTRIPEKKWIGIKSVIQEGDNGNVEISLLLDRNNDGEWEEIANAVDDGRRYGGAVIGREGHAGIRTDYMDAEFDNYDLREL